MLKFIIAVIFLSWLIWSFYVIFDKELTPPQETNPDEQVKVERDL